MSETKDQPSNIDISSLNVNSALIAVDGGLSHTLNNSLTVPIGIVDLNDGPKDLIDALAVFQVNKAEKPVDQKIDAAETVPAVARAKAGAWVAEFTQRMKDLIIKSKLDQKQDPYLAWKNYLTSQVEVTGFSEKDKQEIRAGLERIDYVWQNLNALANDGIIPPIITHPGGTKGEELIFDFSVLPQAEL